MCSDCAPIAEKLERLERLNRNLLAELSKRRTPCRDNVARGPIVVTIPAPGAPRFVA